MSEETLHRIDNIRQKVNSIHKSLIEERLRNENLQKEMASLQKNLLELREQNQTLISENADIKSNMDLTNKQVDGVDLFSNTKSNQEIDEMINEIECCIEQLKK